MTATVSPRHETPQASLGAVTDRVALVTGGTRGIGAEIARALIASGAHIAAGHWNQPEQADQLAADLAGDHPDRRVTLHRGNVGSPEDCRSVVEDVIEQHGRLDILVNNAGITIDRTMARMTDDDWHKVIDVNLSGAFYLSQAALAHMIPRGTGRIISISSIIGEIGNIGQVNYAASKSGLFGLTKSMAREAGFQLRRANRLDDNGIGLTVNAVAPGFIATEMLDTVPEKVLDGIRQQVVVGRLGRPEEIARVVNFLAADGSGYVTGQIWSVNGGLDM